MSHGFLTSASGVAAGSILTLLLLAACVSDARTRRIPNGIVALIGVSGLAYAVALRPGTASLLTALAAMALGIVVWLPFHVARMLGAGDVKLFAAASAWLAPMAVLNAALVAALAGGVLSLAWMIRHQGGAFTFFRLTQMASVSGMRTQVVEARARSGVAAERSQRARLPYGIAMSVGLLATFWLRFRLF